MSDLDVAAILTDAVHAAAVRPVASIAPRWISLVVETTRDLTLPATASEEAETLGERLDEGRPLTPLAEPEVEEALGDYGARPATVADLLAAHGTDGERVISELERLCALEAARLAPPLADQLVADHPDLLTRIADRHPDIAANGTLDPAAALCAEVAALLAMDLLATVSAQLADVPLSPNAPTS